MEVQPMDIRRARHEDADQVFELADQLFESRAIERGAFDTIFPALLADSASCCLVASVSEQIDGYACGYSYPVLHANGRIAYLNEMVVSEELRHSGIGRQLVAAFESWAQDEGCLRAALATETAGPFYENLGYTRDGTHYSKVLGEAGADAG